MVFLKALHVPSPLTWHLYANDERIVNFYNKFIKLLIKELVRY